MNITIKCIQCNKDHVLEVEKDDLEYYITGAGYVHEIFPYLSADERELLISRTCGPCFDLIFNERATGKCPNCGGLCYNGKTLCSDKCEKSYIAYLNGEEEL